MPKQIFQLSTKLFLKSKPIVCFIKVFKKSHDPLFMYNIIVHVQYYVDKLILIFRIFYLKDSIILIIFLFGLENRNHFSIV